MASQQGVANRREKLDIVLDAVDLVGLQRGGWRGLRVGARFDTREGEFGAAFGAGAQQTGHSTPGKGIARLENVDVIAAGFAKASIDRFGHAPTAALLDMNRTPKPPADVFAFEHTADRGRGWMLRPVVDNDDFKRLVVLIEHRTKRRLDRALVTPRRQDDCNER